MSALPPKADIAKRDGIGRSLSQTAKKNLGLPAISPSPESLLRLDEYIRRLGLSASIVCPMAK